MKPPFSDLSFTMTNKAVVMQGHASIIGSDINQTFINSLCIYPAT